MLSSATLDSWKAGRTLPHGRWRAAVFRVFWPNPGSANRDERVQFRDALAVDVVVRAKLRTRTAADSRMPRQAHHVRGPGVLGPNEKTEEFVRACEICPSFVVQGGERGFDLSWLSTCAHDFDISQQADSWFLALSKFIDAIERPKQADERVQAITGPLKRISSNARRVLPAGSILKDQSFSPDLVSVAPGEYWMGSRADDGDAYSNEFPLVKKEISRPFYLGRFPVTFNEYEVFADDCGLPVPDDEGWGRGPNPVIHVSWEDAAKYTRWLSTITKCSYRLCTEVEWEYAARAGSAHKFTWGDEFDITMLNACEREGYITPVGSYPPNDWGLYDMLGNVWEWMADDWFSTHSSRPKNECARLSEPRNLLRTLRGGAWDSIPRNARIADRCRQGKENRINNVGFRVVRDT